jgi:hypothetical protein
MASLGASLLGRRVDGRRVPLSFAQIEPEAPDGDIPEVLRQIERLATALGLDTPEPDSGDGVKRRRVACTVRLDPTRHAQLRQIANARATSAQCVLVDAFDQYLNNLSVSVDAMPTIPATPPIPATSTSRAERPTRNQP